MCVPVDELTFVSGHLEQTLENMTLVIYQYFHLRKYFIRDNDYPIWSNKVVDFSS